MISQIYSFLYQYIFKYKVIVFFEREPENQCAELVDGLILSREDDLTGLAIPEEVKGIIKKEFKLGSLCYLIFVDGEIAHYSFVSIDRISIGELCLAGRLNESCAYIYNCYTFDKFRGMGLFRCAIKELTYYYHGRKMYICSDIYNVASQTAIIKSGFHYIFSIRLLKFSFIKNYINRGLIKRIIE